MPKIKTRGKFVSERGKCRSRAGPYSTKSKSKLELDNTVELEGKRTTKQGERGKYVNHTGGAKGSDLYWQKMATKYNIVSKVYSFEKHGGKNTARVVLSQNNLNLADDKLKAANKTLKRNFPTRNKFSDNLLRRNWYQVKDTDAVFAIGIIAEDKKTCDGGTGWTIQMAIDNNIPVYVYDCIKDRQTKRTRGSLKWYFFDRNLEEFIDIQTGSPTLTYNFTGIGTRSLPNEGKTAIGEVFVKTFGKTT